MAATVAKAANMPGDAERRAESRSRRQQTTLTVVGALTAIAIWELASRQFTGNVLPGPIPVASEMVQVIRDGGFFGHFTASLTKTLVGLGVAIVIGSVVGYLMGRHRYWEAFFHDGVTVAGTIPGITYAILALLIFGISSVGPILAVALISTPYIALNVSEGIRRVDSQLLAMSKAYGRSEAQIRRDVRIPSVVPYILAGIRLAFAVAWKVEALTEIFGGRNGVGFQIKREYQLFDITGFLAWTLLFIVFMLIVERLVLTKIESSLLAWRPAGRENA